MCQPETNFKKQTTKETTNYINNGFQTLDLRLHKTIIPEKGET